MSSIFSGATLCFALVFSLLISTTTVSQDAHKVRRWRDQQTGQSVRAYFAGLENGIVRLETKKGDSFSIALERLRNSDQKYVRKLEKSQPDQVGEMNLPLVQLPQRDVGKTAKQLTRPKKIYGIDWVPIKDAIDEGRQVSVAEDKPVFWFRVLGDLEGFM